MDVVNLNHGYQEYFAAQNYPAGKQKVILAAIELFAQNGYNNVATAKIAQRAGVSEATLFKYFKTKKTLLDAIIAPLVYAFIPQIQADLASRLLAHLNTLQDFVTFFVNDRYEFLRKNRNLVLIMLQETLTNAKFREQIIRKYTQNMGESIKAINAVLVRFTPKITFEQLAWAIVPVMLGDFVATSVISKPNENSTQACSRLIKQIMVALTE